MPEDTKMPALHSVDDGHERRLQNAEHTIGELKTEAAEAKLNLSFIAKEVQDGFQRFGEHLNTGFSNIQSRLDEGEGRMNAMSERIGEHGRKFDKIDEEKRRSAEKWDAWKKWLATAVTGAVAIGLKELVSFLAHHL